MATAQKTKRRRNPGGGWNRKSVEDHLAEGTYRRDRHGALPTVLDFGKKPPGRVRYGKRATRRWIRSAADERAWHEGCRFNERLAQHVDDFFRKMLRHSAGQWAGKPFEPTDWQRDNLLWPLFGWVRPDGLRRFRRTYIEQPKKQGKSALASGIGLYGLTADGEAGAEIYSFGADRDQAGVVHREAINMVEWSPKLDAVLKINRTTGAIVYRGTKSYYKQCSGTPRGKHGIKPHFGICDELHEWYGSDLWESIRYAYRMRRQPLSLVITNAGDDLESVCYQLRERAMAVLAGEVYDPGFFVLICSVTKEEAESEVAAVRGGATELPVARKCNPHLGIITREADLLQDIQDAIATPSELANLLRLTYGVWEQSADPWLSLADWQECHEKFSEADLEGQACDGGLDLSRKRDLTSLVLIFPGGDDEPGILRQLAWHWLPEESLADLRKFVDVDSWGREGWLRTTPGRTTDYDVIGDQIAEILGRFEPRHLAYDPMYATEMTQRLAGECAAEMVEFKQTIMQFALPTAQYERLVVDRTLRHNGNPVLAWQAGHVQVKHDPNSNIRPVKPKPNDHRKIDGIVAGIMALGMSHVPEEPPRDYYETHELEMA